MRYLTTLTFLLATTHTALAAENVNYQRDVLPILETYCIGCHTEDEAQGGLVMESHEALMVGGESGVAITPGEPASSRLLMMIRGQLEPNMPPEGEEQPGEEELEVLATWIQQGALGPGGNLPLKRELRTPKIKTEPGVVLPITAFAFSADGSMHAVARYGAVEVLRSRLVTATALAPSAGASTKLGSSESLEVVKRSSKSEARGFPARSWMPS